MQRWKKYISAIGYALAALGGNASAQSGTEWDYRVSSVFVTGSGAISFNGQGPGTNNGCEQISPILAPNLITWGACPEGGPGIGRSGLGINSANNPQTGVLTINGPGQPANTYIHYNNVVNSIHATLNTATISATIGLKPKDSVGPYQFETLNYTVKLIETPNTAGTCVDETSPADNPCNDIWVIENSTNRTIVIDGAEYFVNFFALPGMTPLDPELCEAANVDSGCLGFTTVENTANEVNFLLTVTSVLPEVTAPPVGLAGSPYPTTTLTAAGGIGPYTWSAENLPTGMTLNPTTGELSGTPAVGTEGTYTITVTDSNPASPNSTSVTLEILPALTATPPPTATVGQPYSTNLNAAGGQPGYTWTATNLPAGLTLTPQGVLSGTPAAGTHRTYTLTVTDSYGTPNQVNVPLQVVAGNPPDPEVPPTNPPVAVPTLGEWGLGLLIALAAGLGMRNRRRS